MFEIREADLADLDKVVEIHKAAYSRDHFSALLPNSVLADYYKNFISKNSHICLVIQIKHWKRDARIII